MRTDKLSSVKLTRAGAHILGNESGSILKCSSAKSEFTQVITLDYNSIHLPLLRRAVFLVFTPLVRMPRFQKASKLDWDSTTMATYSTNQFKAGLKVILEAEPCTILENEFVKPGKGQAFNRVKFRNLKSGRVWEMISWIIHASTGFCRAEIPYHEFPITP